MGYELRRQLREALGPGITGLQRAVALEIADDANTATRRSWASLEDLARWTGAKDATVVRNALKRLAAAGWEFRVPIGKGKDGRVLYAVPGTRMNFRVPDFEGVAPATPKGERELPLRPEGVAGAHSEGAGATPSGPQGGAGAPSEGAGAPPFSSDSSASLLRGSPGYPLQPSGEPESPQEEPTDAFTVCQPLIQAMTNAGITVSWQMSTEQWADLIHIVRRAGVAAMVEHAVAVARTAREKPRYATFFLAAGWRGLPAKSTPPRTSTTTPPPHCGDLDCDPDTRIRNYDDDQGYRRARPCPDCHPNAHRGAAA